MYAQRVPPFLLTRNDTVKLPPSASTRDVPVSRHRVMGPESVLKASSTAYSFIPPISLS